MAAIEIYDEENLGQALKNRRKALGLTQKDVAKYGNISFNGLSQIELGLKSPRIATLIKLSKILGFKLVLQMEEE